MPIPIVFLFSFNLPILLLRNIIIITGRCFYTTVVASKVAPGNRPKLGQFFGTCVPDIFQFPNC